MTVSGAYSCLTHRRCTQRRRLLLLSRVDYMRDYVRILDKAYQVEYV